MTDMTDRKGELRRVWPKGASVQKGYSSKWCRKFLLLVHSLFGLNWANANPYTLEYAITGAETTTMSTEDYHIEAGWGEVPEELTSRSFETTPDVHGYLALLTDVLTGDSAVLLTEGVEVVPGWKKAGWFGFFFADAYPWVYHSRLGWIFVTENSEMGAWFHRENLGWIWTNPNVFPALFMYDRKEWVYLDMEKARTTLYDYLREEWFELDRPYAILGGAVPGNGGDVAGLGYYYRWQTVRLEARASNNFNFAGWGGDLKGMDTVQEFQAFRDMQVEASFMPLPTAGASAKEVVSGAVMVLEKMDNLTETEKKTSIAELLIFGESKTSGLSIKK
jgi:hypothetical protein